MSKYHYQKYFENIWKIKRYFAKQRKNGICNTYVMYLHHDIDKTKNKTEDNWHIFQVQGSMARECPYKCAPHVCVCVGCSNSECVCPYMFKVSSQHTNTFRKKGTYIIGKKCTPLLSWAHLLYYLNQPTLVASSALCSIREASLLLCIVLWWIENEIDVTCYVFLSSKS